MRPQGDWLKTVGFLNQMSEMKQNEENVSP